MQVRAFLFLLLLQKNYLINSQDIFTISSQKQFEKIALKVFRYQHENNKVYREFCDFLNTDVQKVKSLEKKEQPEQLDFLYQNFLTENL